MIVMENVKYRALSMLILIFVVVCNVLLCEGVSWTKYTFAHQYRGCTSQETVFESKNVFDPITCSKICNSVKGCLTFFFEQTDHKCIGCQVRVETIKNNTLPEAMYFELRETSCEDLRQLNPAAKSGVYQLKLPYSRSKVNVYCEMETGDGGWTVFHNRFDGSVDFYRSFTDYENGFGNLNGEFWLGLKYIQEIAERSQLLRLEMTRQNGDVGYVEYREFTLTYGREYRLSITPNAERTEGVASWKLWKSVLRAFSTKDRDSDISAENCAEELHGAGWYNYCEDINLHGKYCPPGKPCDDGKNGTTGHYHEGFAGLESLKASRIMMKPLWLFGRGRG